MYLFTVQVLVAVFLLQYTSLLRSPKTSFSDWFIVANVSWESVWIHSRHCSTHRLLPFIDYWGGLLLTKVSIPESQSCISIFKTEIIIFLQKSVSDIWWFVVLIDLILKIISDIFFRIIHACSQAQTSKYIKCTSICGTVIIVFVLNVEMIWIPLLWKHTITSGFGNMIIRPCLSAINFKGKNN